MSIAYLLSRVVGAHDRRAAGRGSGTVGVIPVSEIEEFDVILGPLVVLVSNGHRLLLSQPSGSRQAGAADRGFRSATTWFTTNPKPPCSGSPAYARGCRGGRHGSPAAIPDDDTPSGDASIRTNLTLLKRAPARGSFLNADPGSLCLPLHIMSPVITGYRVTPPATDASQDDSDRCPGSPERISV